MRIDQIGVFLKSLEVVIPDAVLQLAAKVIAAADREFGIGIGDRTECELVFQLRLARKNVEAHASDTRGGAGEIRIDKVLVQTDCLKDLCPAIALERRDAHLRKGLKQSFIHRLGEVLNGNVGSHPARQIASRGKVFERLDC